MKIILEHEDFNEAVKSYVKAKFNIDVVSVDITGTKNNMTATIDLPANTTVIIGSNAMEVLPSKAVDTTPFKETKKEDLPPPTPAPVVEAKPEPKPVTTVPNIFGGAPPAEILEEEDTLVPNAPLGDNLFAQQA